MKFRNDPMRHYRVEHLRRLEHAIFFEHIRDIGLHVLSLMPPDVSMIIGPITSGGLGSMKKNVARFRRATRIVASRGENVFTQLIFEDAMQRIKTRAEYYRGVDHLLETVYEPIISEHIKRLIVIPNWQDSYGTNWEIALGTRLGLEFKYLRKDFERRKPDQSIYVE